MDEIPGLPRIPEIPGVTEIPERTIIFNYPFTPLASIPGRVTINDVPDDVVLCIIKWIGNYENGNFFEVARGQNAILQLAKCSWRFKVLTEPALYAHFLHARTDPRDRAIKFLTRILERPDLANRVKEIHACGSHPAVAYFGDQTSIGNFNSGNVTYRIWNKIRRKIFDAGVGLTEFDNWVTKIEYGNWDAVIALIITLTPNVEAIEIKEWSNISPLMTNPVKAYPLLFRVLDQARMIQIANQTENPHGLWKLKRVLQETWSPQRGINIDCLIPSIAIPSVKTFWAHRVDDENMEYAKNWMDTKQTFPNVTELSLYATNISQGSIKHFIRRFTNLKRLCYRPGDLGSVTEFEPPMFLDAIEHLRSSLEDLTIVDEDRHINPPSHQLESYPLGRLISFHNLRRLDIEWQILTGGDLYGSTIANFPCRYNILDVIPASIEWLRLRGAKGIDDVPGQTLVLIANKYRKFPALKTLDLQWKRHVYSDGNYAVFPCEHPGFKVREAFRVMFRCEAAGINLKIVGIPPPPKRVVYPTRDEYGRIRTDAEGNVMTTTALVFYPFTDYDRLCFENGCDIHTGKPFE